MALAPRVGDGPARRLASPHRRDLFFCLDHPGGDPVACLQPIEHVTVRSKPAENNPAPAGPWY